MPTCKNFAISILTASPFFSCSCFCSLFSYVDGSMLGKSLSTTGNASSINGTRSMTINGTKRNMSAVVRVSCRLSLLN